VTTYSGADQLVIAQEVLDKHVTSSADGRCLECGALGPCQRHDQAAKVFMFALRLPRRVPGATRPELVGARRVGVPGLLAHAGSGCGMRAWLVDTSDGDLSHWEELRLWAPPSRCAIRVGLALWIARCWSRRSIGKVRTGAVPVVGVNGGDWPRIRAHKRSGRV
jgi:hypothetical protein